MSEKSDGRFELSLSTNASMLGVLAMTRCASLGPDLLSLMLNANGETPEMVVTLPGWECHAARVDLDADAIRAVTLYGRMNRYQGGLPLPVFGAALRLSLDAADSVGIYYDVRGLHHRDVAGVLADFDPKLPGFEGAMLGDFAQCGWLQYVVMRADGRISYSVAMPDHQSIVRLVERIAPTPSRTRQFIRLLGPLGYVSLSPGPPESFRFYARARRLLRPGDIFAQLLEC